MEGVLRTMNDEAGDDIPLHFNEEDWGLAMFLHQKFIHHREPEPLEEAVLLQALEEYLADHLPHEASSGAGDYPEPSQDDPMEIDVPHDTQQCGWVDEVTHRKCPAFVPAGLQPMLSHLNTAHKVCGSEKESKECRWAVLGSGYESACGATSQRRNMPRHIAKHLGLRWTCNLCDKNFARSDLLKYHARKDHQAPDTIEIDAKSHSWPGFCHVPSAVPLHTCNE